MLGIYGEHASTYLTILLATTTIGFALPIFLAPLSWARVVRWTIPTETRLAIYFGRCLGAFILVVELMILRAVTTGHGAQHTFDVLFVVFALMLVVHVYGALRRIQPMTETLEIALWALLLVLNALFYPAPMVSWSA